MTATSGEPRLRQRPDGTQLHFMRWLPAGAVRGTVQIVHGASEHSGRYGLGWARH